MGDAGRRPVGVRWADRALGDCGPPSWTVRGERLGSNEGFNSIHGRDTVTTAPDEVLFATTGTPLDAMHERPDGESLSKVARAYMLLVFVAAAAVTLPFLARLPGSTSWYGFAVLAAGAAIAQLFMVRTPRNQSYHTTIVFLVPAALILPPQQLALLALVVHIPEWLKYRYRWPLQTFNIANYTVAVMAAWAAAQADRGQRLDRELEPRFAVAGLTASVVLVLVNHALLAVMLYLAYGHSARETGLFSVENLSTELVLAALGVAFAYFWLENPWLIPFAVAPLLLVHRSLTVPALQAEARVDPKTGLFNARHFALALQEELGRAERFQRPLSLIMADLDLLRDINNNYGHLAGDAVLKGIAEVFRAQLRHYDVPARFGGEEFSILLPETPPEQALEIAERIRRAVADRHFDVETSSEPIRVTVSIGVAGYPKDGTDPNELDPPGRPRRLPGEAPGPQPRARRELRAAARAGRAQRPARRGAGGRASTMLRSRQPSRSSRTPSGAPAAARDARAALPLALAAARARWSASSA